jgi:HEAT repeat protein
LREACGKLAGRELIGTINSIGVKRDAEAIDLLAAKMKDKDAQVASVAACALGRIGGAAAKPLEAYLAAAPAAVKSAVAEGLIGCAELCLKADKAVEAARLYDLVRKADVPKQRVLEATRGAILARKAEGVPLLVEQIKSADKAEFQLGLTISREVQGAAATQALLAELKTAPAQRQPLLIAALADRGDESTLPVMIEAVKAGPVNMRVAAIKAVERLNKPAAAEALFEAAASKDADVANAAVDALTNLRGAAIDAEIVARLGKVDETGQRLILMHLAGQRRIAAAQPHLVQAAADADAQVRAGALVALGATVQFADLPLLIARAVAPKAADDAKPAFEGLAAAALRMPDREATAKRLAEAGAKAPLAARVSLLEILGALGGQAALDAVTAAAKGDAPELQDAGTRLLGRWNSADAAPVLLQIAKSEHKYHGRALSGYLRIARQLAPSPETQLAMIREALPLISRDAEKIAILDALRRNASPRTLETAVALLKGVDRDSDVPLAVVAIAEKLVESEPAAAAAALKAVIATGGKPDAMSKATALLEQAEAKGR